jgi:putative redox protein
MEIILGENQKVIAKYKDFEIVTDQPEKAGGDNTALSPFDLFMVSIGTCAGWYVKTYCQKRGISEEGIRIVQKSRFNAEKRLYDLIEIEIILPEGFPEQHREPLVKAASSCTVKKHMMQAPDFSITIRK